MSEESAQVAEPEINEENPDVLSNTEKPISIDNEVVDDENSGDDAESNLPTAELMLDRLYAVNLDVFDINIAMEDLKGQWNWLFILTMPISALLLVIFSLLGLFITDNFIGSFVVSALIVFSVAKIIDSYEQKFRTQARKTIMYAVADIEGDLGLIHHFREFLPSKYRHLWQSVRKKNFQYIEQYNTAIFLLQQKLEAHKFTKLWHLKYPMTDPEHVKSLLEEEALKEKKKERREHIKAKAMIASKR